jgi:hypothetical protein
MAYSQRLRSRTIESAKEEIVKGVASVVENALKIPASLLLTLAMIFARWDSQHREIVS